MPGAVLRLQAPALDAPAADRVRRLIGGWRPDQERKANAELRTRLFASANPMIFGAGQNGRLALKLLREAGLEPTAFIDETPSKIGGSIEGVPVIGLDQAAARPGAFVVCSIFSPHVGYLTIAERLAGRGLDSAPLFHLLRAFGAGAMPFYFLSPPEEVVAAAADICWLAERLADAASLDLLCAQIAFRLTLDFEALPPPTTERAPPPAAWTAFAFVDAGAFDGDTLLPFLAAHGDRISRAVALEPDPSTFERLTRNLAAAGAAEKTLALCCAADAACGQRMFAEMGNQGSQFSDAGVPVETTTIDAVAETHLAGEPRLYVKFDVEGAEAEALAGSARTIARRRPLLAISAYHRPPDLWTLPRLVSRVDDGYRFALRSHGTDGADLMVYAIPTGAGQ